MQQKTDKRMSPATFVLLHASLLFFSFSSVLMKIAANQEFLSFRFLLYYFCSFLILGIYAVVWQQILKKVSLNTAYGNRAITTVWSVIWGFLLFHEKITWTMVLGSVIIIVGVFLVVTADE